MRLRKLDSTGDMIFGHNGSDFYRDQVELVAQSLKTRLLLFTGEWFLDVTQGTPWGGFPINIYAIEQGRILGEHTQATRDIAITERVMSTFGVSAITNYGSVVTGRTWTVSMTVSTIYGNNFGVNINSSGTVAVALR